LSIKTIHLDVCDCLVPVIEFWSLRSPSEEVPLYYGAVEAIINRSGKYESTWLGSVPSTCTARDCRNTDSRVDKASHTTRVQKPAIHSVGTISSSLHHQEPTFIPGSLQTCGCVFTQSFGNDCHVRGFTFRKLSA